MASRDNSEVVTSSVDAVVFNLFTEEEIKKISVVRVTSPVSVHMGYPVPGGLYDLAMGPSRAPRANEPLLRCTTCGETFYNCTGHCGHIELARPVYNPVLMNTLLKLVRRVCFYCHHFLLDRRRVQMFASKLELIVKGDIAVVDDGEIKALTGDATSEESFESSTVTRKTVEASNLNQCEWTSLQYHKAMTVLNKMISEKTSKICDMCGTKNAQISSLSVNRLYQVQHCLKLLWENEPRICSLMWDIQQKKLLACRQSPTYLMFFIKVLLVPPCRFRPPNTKNDSELEHTQTTLLRRVLEANLSLGDAIKAGDVVDSKINDSWRDLQTNVDLLFDSDKASGKKDPFLAVNEIGIPPYFAKKLTYPEKVTPWNAERLRQAVLNGPEIHPGATLYHDEQGNTNLADNLNDSKYKNENRRNSIAKKLLSTPGAVSTDVSGKGFNSNFEGKVVYRHIQDGDIVLVNRQPTLHKPSMMAHVARILKGEKTLRMHYANCSSYNADFDGDEMNVHFPQDEIARAEAYNIVNANEQYIVPTSGEPIRGLIQDHIVSAVLLTKKDTFLTQEEYHHLLYSACVSTVAPDFKHGNLSKKISLVKSDEEIRPLLPAIWKPKPLWTGKQVISTILDHVTRGQPPFTVKRAGRIPAGYFGKKNGEYKVLVHKNELVHGVIDKAQFGKFGLVHAVHELYGASAAGRLFSVFTRLFTAYLQMHGFTCGVDDLLVRQCAEMDRRRKLDESETIGDHVHSWFIGAKDAEMDPIRMQAAIEKLVRGKGESAIARLDRMMSSALNRLTSEVNNSLFPEGLSKSFPSNCLSLMTSSGAKGGLVNFTQISSLLGQQELEGKRVPRMVSGKTLPCFLPWDSAARAGGFISDRFLNGLRPQEYYFHCMAGREGLVDTAIKTARSGYLQRRLMKNLECLRVNYDHTVRDSDGSIIEFIYGEDGVDVVKTSWLTEFKFLAANKKTLSARLGVHQLEDALPSEYDSYIKDLPDALEEKMNKFIEKLSKKKRDSLHLRKLKHFRNLLKLKYFSSLAQPGEAVGVIAAQSIGEPSTQMTLNTFHFAGQGEMNVTLGIPRLQEILGAAKDIRTPVMTCPLLKQRTRDDAERLAAKLSRIKFADVIESMQVHVVPFSVKNGEACTVYKLRVSLYPPELFPEHSDITRADCVKAFRSQFLPKLSKVIEKYLKNKSKGQPNFLDIAKVDQNTGPEDAVATPKDTDDGETPTDDETPIHNDDHEEVADDEQDGADARKWKNQENDEVDYEDDVMETEVSDVDDGVSSDDEDKSNMYEGEDDGNHSEKSENVGLGSITEEEAMESLSEMEGGEPFRKSGKILSKSKQQDHVKQSVLEKSKKDRGKTKKQRADTLDTGEDLEAPFIFPKGCPYLLSQAAEKVANDTYVRSVLGIDQCSVVDYQPVEDYKGEPPSSVAIQTAGTNFLLMWTREDVDIKHLVSNDIHAMLKTYGVEAARATIKREIRSVFGSYGIAVNSRHLDLISDFMTAGGGLRPFTRKGIDYNTSPFLKITYETATRFVVDSAIHGLEDALESPSARIVLGQVPKMGTGCISVLQNLVV
ncbi:DNA-directed RNA polymerase I subunit 1 isoform X2 [Amborella trichopoda]|uniref:DNA-directed RNA polymerase I subunit 1 isoform X2 n=1 Tax=Amborella trichopoda TaxID=13333 RepID=UPI0009C0AD31|nr:DNA-directed RNA polymerase I subunit 1 isoform X2 [Amborella trichopoda]|eukprot:XP_020526321.1 DNA-directed RNA polymerase I subunit 1 isoform X2 [Amborella trichopoda]